MNWQPQYKNLHTTQKQELRNYSSHAQHDPIGLLCSNYNFISTTLLLVNTTWEVNRWSKRSISHLSPYSCYSYKSQNLHSLLEFNKRIIHLKCHNNSFNNTALLRSMTTSPKFSGLHSTHTKMLSHPLTTSVVELHPKYEQ